TTALRPGESGSVRVAFSVASHRWLRISHDASLIRGAAKTSASDFALSARLGLSLERLDLLPDLGLEQDRAGFAAFPKDGDLPAFLTRHGVAPLQPAHLADAHAGDRVRLKVGGQAAAFSSVRNCGYAVQSLGDIAVP